MFYSEQQPSVIQGTASGLGRAVGPAYYNGPTAATNAPTHAQRIAQLEAQVCELQQTVSNLADAVWARVNGIGETTGA